MKKIALGVVAALLLAAFPLTLAGPAVADSTAHVRFVNAVISGAPPIPLSIDIYVDGVLLVAGVPPSSSFGNFFETSQLGNGFHTLQACVSTGAPGLTVVGTCNNGQTVYVPPAPLNLIGGGNYTVVIGNPFIGPPFSITTNVGVPGLFVGNNDVSPTDFNFARYTIHNATSTVSFDLCIDGDRVLTAVAPGTSQQVEVEAQQQANIQLFPDLPTAGCPATAFKLNLVAGTNTIQTLVPNSVPLCGADCVQIIFVDQERHPNVANAAAFCSTLGLLAQFSADYKATFGNIDPQDPFTFPSIGAVKALADEITGLLSSGDLNVTPEIQPQWEIISEGLRNLVFALKIVNYDLTKFPSHLANGTTAYTLEQLVEGANGFVLPGIPHATTSGAVTTFLAWNKANCAAATPITPAPAATPAAAGPRFTG